jgi:hypothetical protein
VAVHIVPPDPADEPVPIIDTCTLDVSTLGLRISCGTAIPLGPVIALKVRAEKSGQTFQLKARAQWCLRPSPFHDYEIGFAILPLEDTDFARWSTFVEQLQEERNGSSGKQNAG